MKNTFRFVASLANLCLLLTCVSLPLQTPALNRTTRLWYTSLAGERDPVMLSEAKHLSERPFVALRVTRQVCQSSVV
jgi:hypothetical protein